MGYLNDIQGFPDPALYPDIAEADCRLVVMHSAQRDGIATRTGHLRPEDALDEIVRFFEARVSALRRSGVAADRLILDPGMGFFLIERRGLGTGDLRSAITFSETLAKFRSRDARDRGLDHA
ncbi:hypothetical protein EIMP300_02290 [Escherichia coli]|uniref:Pterin-binding domain-containing protein n=1 Tax=Escherichia coli TaxID=562 RepID=A0A8S0FHX2_ECOLX|nr:hypothetical protein EIMP300_02290 [Escherichia coli]